MTRATRRPAPGGTFAAVAAAFLVVLGFLAMQIRAGNDPAIGAATPVAQPVAQRPVVIRRVIVKRVVRRHRAAPTAGAGGGGSGGVVASAPAPSGGGGGSAPAPAAPAAAPAPAPAPAVSSAS